MRPGAGLDCRKSPRLIKNFWPGLIEPDGVIPAFGYWQVVDAVRISAEMYGERTIGVCFTRNAVDAVGTKFIFFEVSFPVIETDRPEGIDRHVFDV